MTSRSFWSPVEAPASFFLFVFRHFLDLLDALVFNPSGLNTKTVFRSLNKCVVVLNQLAVNTSKILIICLAFSVHVWTNGYLPKQLAIRYRLTAWHPWFVSLSYFFRNIHRFAYCLPAVYRTHLVFSDCLEILGTLYSQGSEFICQRMRPGKIVTWTFCAYGNAHENYVIKNKAYSQLFSLPNSELNE